MIIDITDKPDCGALSALHRQSFTQGWDRDAFVSFFTIPGTFAFVAEDGSGMGVMRIVLDEAEVLTLAVVPEKRRQGKASAILNAMLAHARRYGVGSVFLEVRAGNPAALKLYARAGFTATLRRKAYYSHPCEDAVVLRRDFLPLTLAR